MGLGLWVCLIKNIFFKTGICVELMSAVLSVAAARASGQWQGGRSDGLHLRYSPLWKNQEGLHLLWHSLHLESHIGT